MRWTLAFVSATIFLTSLTADALEWKSQEATLQLKPGEGVGHAEFAYKNTSKNVVNILAVKAGCDCVATVVGQKTLKPDESGIIKLVYKAGDRVGEQHQAIQVLTDEKVSPATVLRLTAQIPDVLTLEPMKVIWKKGEPRKPRTVRIIQLIPDGQSPQVKSSNPNFKTEVSDGRGEFSMKIVPPVDSTPESSSIRVTVNQALGKPRSKVLRVAVE